VAQQVSRLRRVIQQAPGLNRILANPRLRQSYHAARWRWRKWRCVLGQSLSHEPRGRLTPFTNELGRLANVQLIDALLKCIERPLPMLCVFGGQGASALSGFKRILPALQQVSREGAEKIDLHVIAGADHHFSVPEFTAQVFEIILKWLRAYP
jgi:hypothetical protein